MIVIAFLATWRDDAPDKDETNFNFGDRLMRSTIPKPVGILGHVAW